MKMKQVLRSIYITIIVVGMVIGFSSMQCDPIVPTKIDFDKDLNVTDEVEIKSYFSLVEVLCNTDFSKNVYGNYNVELLIVRPFHEDIKVSNVVNIKPFINITNKGVYCTGYSLNFLGNATLNGMKINSGHSISKSGEYVLNLYDNLGNSNEYKFIVVESASFVVVPFL